MDEPKKPDAQLVDVQVSVLPSVVEAIDELARIQGVTPAEALVRAIGRDRMFVKTVKEGGKVLIEESDRKLYKVEMTVD